MKFFLAFLLFYFCTLLPSAEAQTYYAGGGSTTNCTTMQTSSTPSTTIKAALDCIGTSAGAGANKTVIVKPGTYTENLDEAAIGPWMPRGTSWAAPFTLKAETRGMATIRRNGHLMRWCGPGTGTNYFTIVDGFVFDLSLMTGNGDTGVSISCGASGPNYVRFQYNEWKDSPANQMLQFGHASAPQDGNNIEILYNKFHGGALYNGSAQPFNYPVYGSGFNSILKGNECYDFPSYCFHMNSQDTFQIGNIEISGNYFHHYGSCNTSGNKPDPGNNPAIIFWHASSTGSRIFNNIFNCGPKAISLHATATNMTIAQNTIYAMTTGAIEPQSDTTIKNNIINNNSGFVFSTTGSNISDNFCPTLSAGCSRAGNPLFVNPGTDFHLSSGSPAINAGATLGPPYNVDYSNAARVGAYDIGAYEFAVPVAPPTPQLVLALPLDEGTGSTATDVSGQKNNATLVGGATWDNAGKYGKAIALDGTGYLNVPSSASLALAPAMTLEAWIYPTALSGFVTVIRQDRYFLYAGSDPGYCPAVASAPIGGYSTPDNQYICGTSIPPLNQWSHLTVTYDGSSITFYLDGNIVASQPSTPAMVSASANVTIGASAFGENFIGRIDEPRIYNYARSPTQIVSDMNTPLIGPPAKVVEIAAPASVEISSAASIEISAD